MASIRKHSPARIAIGTIAGLVVLVGTVVGGFNIYIRTTYASFYEQATPEFEIPGLSSGFIPQDIAWLQPDGQEGMWIFCGYLGNYDPSPIWRLTTDGASDSITLEDVGGTPYDGHGGGVTCNGKYVYLTCVDGYLVFDAAEIANAAPGSVVRALKHVNVGFDPAFINICDGRLCTGVFYREPEYPTPDEMHVTTPDGTVNYAVMYVYAPSAEEGQYGFEASPETVYSIPDKVQGVAVLPDGSYVFSTSWGFSPSHLPVYDLSLTDAKGEYMVDGKPVELRYFEASNLVRDIEAPPMSEGIVEHDGRLYVTNEAATNKYIFGKLYDGGKVYSLVP